MAQKTPNLYSSWTETARRHADHMALLETSTGRRWSFRQLALAAEKAAQRTGPTAFPQGTSAEFIVTLLAAWRDGQVVCPLESGQPAPHLESPLPSGIVHLKTTSATTGTPRLVAFTAEQLMADARNIVSTMGLSPEFPNVGIISLAHSYGFSNLVLPLLLHGVPLLLAEAPLPEALRHAADAAPAVTLAAVPALWRAWYDAGAIPTNLHLAISAGAPLPLALEQAVFERHGLKIHNFYGSSECGGIAYDGAATPRADASCVGAPLRYVQVAAGEDGCIQVRGGAVAESYWPAASARLGQGIFRSNDLGELSEGLVFLRGRACDQINVAGRKVLPETIERVLVKHPHVRECLAFGVPSSEAERGEIVVACVATSNGLTGETLRQFAMSHLPAWQVPREWWLMPSLEVNGRGKLSRAEWRKRFLENRR